MFNLKHWLNLATNPQDYLWIEALLIKETPKAILIEFDGKQTWLPKAWIVKVGRNEAHNVIKIYISQYFWAKGR